MKLNILFSISAFLLMVKGQDPGTITDFHQISETKETIQLFWTFTPGDLEFKRNDVVRDSEPPVYNGCSEDVCLKLFHGMKACSRHYFYITPFFVDPSDPTQEIPGAVANTTGHTDDEVPGPPENLHVVEQTYEGTIIEWSAPETFPDCAATYRLCSKLEGEKGNCTEVLGTSVLLHLELCSSYKLSVAGITPSGIIGSSADITFDTPEGVPGPVVDLQASNVSSDSINVTFRTPEVNPNCFAGYNLGMKAAVGVDDLDMEFPSNGENSLETFSSSSSSFSNRLRCEPCYMVFSPLWPCTNYTITVIPYNPSFVAGEESVITVSTTEEVPGPPENIHIVEQTYEETTIEWWAPACAATYRFCSKLEDEQENCTEVLGTSVLLHPELCSFYNISVAAITPSGIIGQADDITFDTLEGVPGPVVNLTTTNVGSDFINVTFRAPVGNTYCVDGYIYSLRPTVGVDESTPKVTPNRQICDPCYASFAPLTPGTNFTISISAYNPSKVYGEETVITAATTESATNYVGNLAIDEVSDATVTYTFAYLKEEEEMVFDVESVIHNLDEGGAVVHNLDEGGAVVHNLDEGGAVVHNLDEGGAVVHLWSSSSREMEYKSDNEKAVITTITEKKDGLSACTKYQIGVRTITRQGVTSSWKYITFVTQEGKPGQPRNLEEKSIDETSITFIYYQPLENPSCASSYKIIWESEAGEMEQKYFVPEHPFPFQMEEEIKDLTPCMKYSITVLAVDNYTGKGELSKPLEAKTLGC